MFISLSLRKTSFFPFDFESDLEGFVVLGIFFLRIPCRCEIGKLHVMLGGRLRSPLSAFLVFIYIYVKNLQEKFQI